MNKVRTSVLGYPRIGRNREWKRALESYWAGRTTEEELQQELKTIRLGNLRTMLQQGIDLVPVGDFTLYDQVLDTAAMFGIVPPRFGYTPAAGTPVPLPVYFAMARGSDAAAASEMTKWFNTNYHYIVPELADAQPVLTVNRPLEAYLEAKRELGLEGKPVLIGPYTFVKLSKGYSAAERQAVFTRFLPLYEQVLRELEAAGVQWLQIDEPALALDVRQEELDWIGEAYNVLRRSAPSVKLLLQTCFESLDHYETISHWPVDAIGLDFVHGLAGNLEAVKRSGLPAGKLLGAGIIDGRGIWAADYEEKLQLLKQLAEAVGGSERLIVQTSCSLLHVPVTTEAEAKLAPVIRDALAFAEQKLIELRVTAQALEQGEAQAAQPLAERQAVLAAFRALPERCVRSVREAAAAAGSGEAARTLPFAQRQPIQQQRWQLPYLPTTTIGSFPQTKEVRQARQLWRKGEWDEAQYRAFIEAEIRNWIERQEHIGLDVLVHGEFERTDMVEFFGEKLSGFFFTANGWVQSYGSRCVKPPVIYADVSFKQPMTVAETVYAQSLTSKPVKGMLTGPVTVLNWSFVRDDLPRREVANQIALALRQEVEALESAGIGMIQVDEPALREGLPLKSRDKQAYLDWAVQAFKLTTSTVQTATQIHTHMCYCEFHDVIDSIQALDADVISLETSRSHGELIRSFHEFRYDKGLGLGVYDIHSPRIPSVEEMYRIIDQTIDAVDPQLLWINPDCGLKTRGIAETDAALRNMVQAAREARAKHAVQTN